MKRTACACALTATSALLAAGLCALPHFHLPLMYIEPFLGVIVLFFSVVYGKSLGTLRLTQLIMDNQILHIQPARISDITNAERECYRTDIYISCFGVLADNRIFLFNMKNIRLQRVEIGSGQISFIRRRKRNIEKLSILHTIADRTQLDWMIARLRYETGIEPVVVTS